jgi:hypothetical protein
LRVFLASLEFASIVECLNLFLLPSYGRTRQILLLNDHRLSAGGRLVAKCGAGRLPLASPEGSLLLKSERLWASCPTRNYEPELTSLASGSSAVRPAISNIRNLSWYLLEIETGGRAWVSYAVYRALNPSEQAARNRALAGRNCSGCSSKMTGADTKYTRYAFRLSHDLVWVPGRTYPACRYTSLSVARRIRPVRYTLSR